MSRRRRPMTSPPGGGSITSPQRASSGPASRIEARIRAQSSGSRSAARMLLGVDRERVALAPFGRRADRADQLHQRLGVANARDVLERDRMLGQQRRGDDRQRGVLVAGRARWCRTAGGRPQRCIEGVAPDRCSHVHIGAERIVLDEFAARFDHVAHQLGEDVVGLVDLLDLAPAAASARWCRAWFPRAGSGSSRRGLCSAAAPRPCGRRRSPPRTG